MEGTRGTLRVRDSLVQWQITDTAASLVARRGATSDRGWGRTALEWDIQTRTATAEPFTSASRTFYTRLHSALTTGTRLPVTPEETLRLLDVRDTCRTQDARLFEGGSVRSGGGSGR